MAYRSRFFLVFVLWFISASAFAAPPFVIETPGPGQDEGTYTVANPVDSGVHVVSFAVTTDPNAGIIPLVDENVYPDWLPANGGIFAPPPGSDDSPNTMFFWDLPMAANSGDQFVDQSEPHGPDFDDFPDRFTWAAFYGLSLANSPVFDGVSNSAAHLYFLPYTSADGFAVPADAISPGESGDFFNFRPAILLSDFTVIGVADPRRRSIPVCSPYLRVGQLLCRSRLLALSSLRGSLWPCGGNGAGPVRFALACADTAQPGVHRVAVWLVD